MLVTLAGIVMPVKPVAPLATLPALLPFATKAGLATAAAFATPAPFAIRLGRLGFGVRLFGRIPG